MSKSLKIVVVADRLGKLNPKGDSTLALAHTAMQRGHQVEWVTEGNVRYVSGEVRVNASRCLDFELGTLPRIEQPKDQNLAEFDACWIRRDPPFDIYYIKLCWLLALVESRVWMMNRPSLLVRYHEKILQLEAHAEGFLQDEDMIETHIGLWDWAKKVIDEKQWSRVVTKPFLGYGGNEINRWEATSLLGGVCPSGADDQIVQPYMDAVVDTGDRRVFLVYGEVLAHFVRIPKVGNFVSNLAQGGRAVSLPLTDQEHKSLNRLGHFLKEKGIFLAGADVIEGRISEVNITSPTGLMNLLELEKKNYANDILERMESEICT